ncbi:proline-rich transmembrane 1-like [Pelobates cultripes]|uniref:Proline-rich transmembrane 1-like n=1 Tax=Pelobates cultripes TaxID=61616 RepID=A0AAD1VV88_PELCU|nr:proline-rich transmembrane 1-like [Pelobates cultripes]
MKADSGSIYPPPYSYNMDYQWAPPIQPGYNINPALYPNGQPMVSYATQPDGTPIVTTQPNVMVIPQPAHNDYLCLSIVSLILCFLPLGVAAVIYSCKTVDSMRRGDMIMASSESRTSFTLNMVALGLGIVGHVAWISFVIYYYVMINKFTYSYYENNTNGG